MSRESARVWRIIYASLLADETTRDSPAIRLRALGTRLRGVCRRPQEIGEGNKAWQ